VLQEALTVLPKVKKDILIDEMEERLLLSFADAAEGQGDIKRALEFDEQVKRLWFEQGGTKLSVDFADCYRRHALDQLAMGLPHEAAISLKCIPRLYLYCCLFSRIGHQFYGAGPSALSDGRTQGPG